MTVAEKRAARVWFHCPGCNDPHAIVVDEAAGWSWNQSVEAPTFSPSVLVTGGTAQIRCHSFVTDGQIEFLADSTHALAGQTVPLPEWHGIEF